MSRAIYISLTVVMTCVLGACGSDTRPISGYLAAPECAGGYDIENSEVELRNEKNEIIGTGDTSANLIPMFVELGCVVEFRINEVPNAKFYSLAIGTHEGPNYSLDELEAENWQVDLSLGDAIADFHKPSLDDFCEDAEALDQHLDDLETFNNDQDHWLTELEIQLDTLATDGAGWALEGEDKKAEEISTAISGLQDLRRRIDNSVYTPVARLLNKAVDPANREMPGLMVPCDQTWLRHSYAPK